MYNSEIESLPIGILRDLQSERLQEMIHRTLKVPFYKKLYEIHDIDLSEIKRIEDIYKLPFTKKSDLRDQYPFGLFTVPMNEVARIHASSGTTGKPTVVGYTLNDLNIFDEVVARSLVAAGAKPGMRLHNAYGYGLFTGGLGLHGGATKLGMAVIPVSGGMTDRQLMILKDFKPEVISCTPSYAQTLGQEIKKRGIPLTELNLKYAVLGAEPWTESVRQEVEELLEVTATNIYGLSEIIGPGVSQEDFEEKGTGSYIWEDHFYPEIVDPDSGEPLPEGKEGVLVFTTLTKEAMPLVRYWTNDICSLHYDKGAKRTHIKMGTIKGRADDMLIIRGVNFFPTQAEELLAEIEELTANYQLIIKRSGSLDSVDMKVEMEESFSESASKDKVSEIAGLLKKKIKDNVGISITTEVVQPFSIPRSEGGKLNRVVDLRS